ncbi:SGNH/GDSL hydrolase family protein [Solirubrum puertoriconensis]|uniref:G-D-S-L family lipolytic protein n=1 Tax=Solirubrum puertoriconensis TaxID=1751427 RepID=A0A9X0HHW8_SOLP1|nr:SGNH/GDSL hydrolase family protein [Solirubrum puertoriconensis]KUG06163.1 hypothetical protein ASU33_02000 [Solirubrum puertoriconensis]
MYTFLKKGAPALALLGLALGSCQPELDEPKASAGSADFSRYIAVGNSLTAGFQDNGLYREGQLNSYPALLAQQFRRVGGGEFTQPLFTEAQANGSGYLRLAGFTAQGAPITAQVAGNAGRNASAPASPPYTKYLEPINNLGVPGIRMSDITTAGYGSTQGNPFFERITPDNTPTQTYLQRISASNPTFFTFWLGNNDVLGYATAGGAANSITARTTFTNNANSAIDALTANGAKGVVALIPDVANIPFFTTVGPTFRTTLAQANVPTAAPFVYTTGILAPGQPNTRVTNNTIANIRDASGNGNLLLTLTASPYLSLYGRPSGKYWRDFYQQARPSLPPTVPNLTVFLLALQVDTTKAFGQSTENPFPSTLVLDGTEQTNVRTATTNFNADLTTKANQKDLAIFDANSFFNGVATGGFATNGQVNSASFISGNLFSLDGVHPTPRGYAVVANEMIRVINQKYGSSIPFVDASAYRGVRIP